ncbi:MAG TPA: hypothetical protein VG294_13340 [Solirubrobacteraceae bacterium]|jgi:hypothetical protein|nr:hypothetical protein [Solirubrobacteraceae bacterium]
MIAMMYDDTISRLTMAASDLIERVAEAAELDRQDVERVLELTGEGLRQAAERHETLDLAFGSGKGHVVLALMMTLARAEQEGSVDEPTMATLTAIRNLVAHAQTVNRLVDVLMPDQTVLATPAVILQARRNAEARNGLLAEFGAFRSHEVADLAGSHASNRAALANRWRAENRVVAVPVRDELLYPGFQFADEGRPRPAIKAVLDALRSDPHTTDWQAALWFATPTSWLGGRRPVDVLDEDPEAVTEAARREVGDVAS